MQLDLDGAQFGAIVALLDRLHEASSMPVGQSVRDGSAERGGLFDRHEPEIRMLEDKFCAGNRGISIGPAAAR